MSSIRINLSKSLITLVVLIFTLRSQNGAFATEQKNTTDVKPESPLWQISSTQTSVVPTTSSIETSSTSLGPTPSSQGVQSPSSSVSSISVSQPHNTARDEIYIDDEGLEGSGGRGEIHDDLEKEPEYSGSGFGPDDEDSSSSTTHQRKKVNGGYKSTNAGNGGYKTTNSKNKEPLPDSKNSKQPEKHLHFPTDTNEDDLETGSGDKDIDTDDEDGGDDDREEDREPIVPTEEEEGDNTSGRSGLIPSVTNTNTDEDDNGEGEDEDGGDLITEVKSKEVENTDDIPIDRPNLGTDNDLSGGEGNEIDLDKTGKSDIATGKPIPGDNNNPLTGNEVFIMDNRGEDRTASFFAQPGILAAVIGGAVVGLLCAILVVMFIVYRMRKKDEGSYALDEPKRSPAVNSYAKNANNREFYA